MFNAIENFNYRMNVVIKQLKVCVLSCKKTKCLCVVSITVLQTLSPLYYYMPKQFSDYPKIDKVISVQLVSVIQDHPVLIILQKSRNLNEQQTPQKPGYATNNN